MLYHPRAKELGRPQEGASLESDQACAAPPEIVAATVSLPLASSGHGLGRPRPCGSRPCSDLAARRPSSQSRWSGSARR